MAKHRADRDVSASDKKRARAKADKVFEKKAKEPAQRVLPDLSANGLKAADIRFHFSTIKGLKAKVGEANAHYSNARKRCKEAGFDPKVVTDLMKIEADDPLAVALYFKQLSQGAEAVGIAIQQEMPFTGSAEGGVAREAQILDDGIKAGVAAKGTDTSPHDESTPAGQIWLQGWHIGQARNASGIKQTPPEETEQPTAH
jgi:hypothetical protein